jgi:glycosyltransferase involved in cell wall biosynthesis
MGGLKRIIFTVTNDLSYDQRMQKICRSLSHAGYAVELVGRQRDFSIPLAAESFEQTRLKCIFNKGKLFYIEYNIRLLIYLTFSQFDAACAVDLDTIAPVYIIGKLKGAKLVYDAHEYFTEVPEVVRRPQVQKVWQWIEKIFVPLFDAAYTVSEGLAELFQQKYNKHFEVIMNVPVLEQSQSLQEDVLTAQPLSPFRPLKGKPEPVLVSPLGDGRGRLFLPLRGAGGLLYQGALNEGRGLEHLITAMQQIDCPLKLAGEGDLSAQLRRQVKDLQLDNKITFLGYVPPAQLKKITAEATIGINLVENTGLSYYYSLSNKFFDYIHASVPQVCIGFPEYEKLNKRYNVALLVKDCSTLQITEALNRLLKDHNLYRKLQKNCEVCTRDLNWQREEIKLLAIYDRLLR